MFLGLYIVKGILAIFLPPLVAFMERGCGLDLVINIIFTIFGWIPGIIHAWYLLFDNYDKEKKGLLVRSSNAPSRDNSSSSNPETTSSQPSNAKATSTTSLNKTSGESSKPTTNGSPKVASNV